MTRVLLADDHPMIRTALEVLLRNSEYEIVGTAVTGQAAAREVDGCRPTFCCSISKCRAEGDGGASPPRARKAPLKIILLTAAIDDGSLLEAKSLKVQGIVLKNSDPAYPLDCLDSVRHGRTWIDPELSERAKQLANRASGAATRRRPTRTPADRLRPQGLREP